MPMITVAYATPRSASGLKQAVAATASRLAAQILRKDPKVTAVLVEEVAATDWFCAGESLADARLASFWLDIRITDGTNTKDEKAAFVAAAFCGPGQAARPAARGKLLPCSRRARRGLRLRRRDARASLCGREACGGAILLERDDLSSNRHPALYYLWSKRSGRLGGRSSRIADRKAGRGKQGDRRRKISPRAHIKFRPIAYSITSPARRQWRDHASFPPLSDGESQPLPHRNKIQVPVFLSRSILVSCPGCLWGGGLHGSRDCGALRHSDPGAGRAQRGYIRSRRADADRR